MNLVEANERRAVLENELLDLTGRHELSAAEVERVYQIQEELADIKRLEEKRSDE